jgi:hypothetical protein
MRKVESLFGVLSIITFCGVAYGAHPLITDDAGTQGKGRFQVEANSEFSCDKEREGGITERERSVELAAIVSYGVTENADVVLGLPYLWCKAREDHSISSDADGISDVSLELKWRFYEEELLSLALKPGITFPAGDDEKGLGAGRLTYGLFFITTREIEPCVFHLNLGYTRNENTVDERGYLWHVSLAAEAEIMKELKIVANAGLQRSSDKTRDTYPAFVLGGVIYSVSEKFDIDFGVKGGLNKPETDYSILAGIALRF